ncbi:MAG: FKBP-type peptidyl-prolyl cis-trans isomerase [Muribaculaceae bacterium]|nr:FKBP-type peptidyl-prolyl cis-trans isomerase [Muribaculaceae bacterium]
MKKLPLLLISAILLIGTIACDNENKNVWKEYKEWREINEAWILEQTARTNPDGTPYYNKVSPSWDPAKSILIHYFNDRSLTANNLTPLLTSTVDVKYIGRLYNDEVFDSSYTLTKWGDSIYRTKCLNVIPGWQIALEKMHVGDSVEIIIPYQSAYGAADNGVIKPYSALVFNVKLVDVYAYEKN